MPNLIHQQWRLNPVGCLHLQRWADEYVLFNAASGKTHFLNELSMRTLQLGARDLLNKEKIINQLTTLYDDFILDDDVLNYIQDMLQDLEEQGLIEPVLS
jgi:PqqD family protein of HPr-rel-A system